jgi:hypothetical protein
MNKATRLWVTLALGAASASAAAEGLDGTAAMLCAATSSVVCASGETCVAGAPGTVNLPVFWHVDPVAKTVRSKSADGSKRESAIATVSSSGGKLVMQGADEGFGWSVSIDPSSGAMVLTGGRDVGYLVFGECTSL